MNYKISEKSKFEIITISDSINIISELTDLKDIIETQLSSGKKNIAVHFLNADYLYSGAISVLVSVYKQITEKGGKLCIIEPNQKIVKLLEQMCITNIIPVVDDLDSLPFN